MESLYPLANAFPVRTVHPCSWLQAAGHALLLALLGGLAGWGWIGWLTSVSMVTAVHLALAVTLARAGRPGPGPADRITLLRAVLTAAVAAAVVPAVVDGAQLGGEPGHGGSPALRTTVTVAAAGVALVLDGLDGRVARRTGTVSALGARFDMEVDALLILVLSVQVALIAGAWVLAIGAARYLLLAAGRTWPWLARPSPPRFWCKVVAVVQGVVLAMAATGALPRALVLTMVAVALGMLVESFGRQVRWLYVHRGGGAEGRQQPVAPALSR